MDFFNPVCFFANEDDSQETDISPVFKKAGVFVALQLFDGFLRLLDYKFFFFNVGLFDIFEFPHPFGDGFRVKVAALEVQVGIASGIFQFRNREIIVGR